MAKKENTSAAAKVAKAEKQAAKGVLDGLFLTGKSLPNYVEAVFASRRLPPKAAVSAYGRHSFVEGIRNGGLDVTQNRRSTLKIHYGRTKLPTPATVFSFPVYRGRIVSII